MTKKTVGKELKFLNALLRGKAISRKQAKGNHHLGNPSATVHRLVQSGFEVQRTYTPIKIKSNGKSYVTRTVKYQIG